jgi:hypothetical protein
VTALTVPDVLRHAEAVLAERGWCRGDYEDEQGHVCARGAINLVVTGLPWEEGEHNPLATSATWALAKYLNGYWAADVSDWNDAAERTEAEVRAALLAAAQRAEAGT